MLDYFPNADHAGIYAALESGEYERAGLEVEIEPPPDPSAPLKFLQAGRADLVVSYEPELLLAREKGAELVSVGALVQKPLTSLMAVRKSPVRDVEDLRGKRVGTAGLPYQTAYLRTILGAAGIDPGSVRETNVGFNLVPAMRSGRVDATLGAFWNYEGVQLARQGDRAAHPAHGRPRRPHLRGARVRRPGGRTSTRRARRASGASSRPRRAGTSCCARARRSASTGCWPPTPGSTAASRRRSWRPPCRCSSPPTPSGPSAGRTRTSGTPTRPGCASRS